jgi:hypothetical protein
MSQEKVSIPPEEWKLVEKYFEDHKQDLFMKGIKNPTALVRRWILEKYQESI